MQATSTNIRQHRFASGQSAAGREEDLREQGRAASDHSAFAARRAQVAAIHAAILEDGSPELHADSTALCSHFKLRRGAVGLERAEAQLTSHAAGAVVRFWVYDGHFGVKVRDLVMLPSAEKGWDLWLDADGRLFPHEGKYSLAGQKVMLNALRESAEGGR